MLIYDRQGTAVTVPSNNRYVGYHGYFDDLFYFLYFCYIYYYYYIVYYSYHYYISYILYYGYISYYRYYFLYYVFYINILTFSLWERCAFHCILLFLLNYTNKGILIRNLSLIHIKSLYFKHESYKY